MIKSYLINLNKDEVRLAIITNNTRPADLWGCNGLTVTAIFAYIQKT
jgi:hypothetical protein